MTTSAPPRPSSPAPAVDALPRAEPRVDPEALIAEARRRQRKRRLVLASLVVLLGLAGAASYLWPSHSGTPSSASSGGVQIGEPRSLQLHLRGFGTPVPTQVDHGPCPQGRGVIRIVPRGFVSDCVLTISKWDAWFGVRRITQTARETYHLRDGTIVTRERQTIRFARDQHHTTATFAGRVLGGSGRYAHVGGTVTGGGPGVNGRANWLVSLHLSYR